jgi:hypothetical protein
MGNSPDSAEELKQWFENTLSSAERNGIVVVTSAGDSGVRTSILTRPFALYELTI